jgi:tetratricopeptide (TPR) repeat protein
MSEIDFDSYKQLADSAFKSGDYGGAESLWFAALQTIEFEGENDSRLLDTLDGLAECCFCQGNSDQSKNLSWESVTLKEKYRGAKDISLAINVKRLAAIYYEQNRLPEATQLGQRLLEIYEADGEKNHRQEIAEICLHLAVLFHRQEKFSEGQYFYEKGQKIKETLVEEGNSPKVVKPFAAKSVVQKVCGVCGRKYAGEVCLKCTVTSIKAFTPTENGSPST